MICASALFMCSYVAVAFSIEYALDENTALPCAVIACILHQLGRATGEATVLGYMKALPQELIVPFSTGQGVAVFFELFSSLSLQELDLWNSNQIFVFLAMLVLPYYHLFAWIEDKRLFHKQFRNVFKVDQHALDTSKQHQYVEL